MASDSVTRLGELIDGIQCAILTTVRPNGTLHSCPMATTGVDANGVVWFLSANNTAKVEAARTSQQVNVAFIDHSRQRYVSVSGFCELVRDTAKAKQLWDPSFASWLPGGLDDPNLILMKIDVQSVEYWDADAGRPGELSGFASAAFD